MKRGYIKDGIHANRLAARRCTCGCTKDGAARKPLTIKDSLAAAAAQAKRMAEYAARLRAPYTKETSR